MRLRLAERFNHKTITLGEHENEVVWSKKDPVHDVDDALVEKLEALIKMGWLVEVVGEAPSKAGPEPDPGDELEEMMEDLEKEAGPLKFDEWVKGWDGEELPPELNSKSELMRLKRDQLIEMAKALKLCVKTKDRMATEILEQFEDEPEEEG